MIKRLQRELDEIKDSQGHMFSEGIDSDKPKDNFLTLIDLSRRVNSRFKIVGDLRNFRVVMHKPDNYIYAVSLFVFFLYSILILVLNEGATFFWNLTLFSIIITSIYYLFFPFTKNLQIDTLSKEINYTTKNIFGKQLRSKQISFQDFDGFTYELKKTSGIMSGKFNRIYFHTNKDKFEIVDLVCGPIYFINHNIFMTSLTRIIKNAA